MSQDNLPDEVRRYALQLLGWAEHGRYAFAWKNEATLIVSWASGASGKVYEVDLERRTTRQVGGSGEYDLAGKLPARSEV